MRWEILTGLIQKTEESMLPCEQSNSGIGVWTAVLILLWVLVLTAFQGCGPSTRDVLHQLTKDGITCDVEIQIPKTVVSKLEWIGGGKVLVTLVTGDTIITSAILKNCKPVDAP